MSTYNLKSYKDAKLMLPHIETILKIFNLTEKSLDYYRTYVPAAKVLQIVREQKKEMEFYHKVYKNAKDNKGKK